MVCGLRSALCALLFSVAVISQAPLRPGPAEISRIQEENEAFGLKRAEESAARAATNVGSLSPEANRALQRWSHAVVQWKKDTRSKSAAAFLAEGVLFDCLGRLHGVKTAVLFGIEKAVPFFSDLAAARPGRAAKAFREALVRDPSLVEAQFRGARIAAESSPSALQALERLASDAVPPFSYLAAMSRAEAAREASGRGDAVEWYQRAAALQPGSPSAAIALSGLTERAVDFDHLNREDVYYSYPCAVITQPVASELADRILRVRVRR